MPLHYACRENAAEVAVMILTHDNADVSARDDKGMTPLHVASEARATETARVLVSRDDIDNDARTKEYQWTPLHSACS